MATPMREWFTEVVSDRYAICEKFIKLANEIIDFFWVSVLKRTRTKINF